MRPYKIPTWELETALASWETELAQEDRSHGGTQAARVRQGEQIDLP